MLSWHWTPGAGGLLAMVPVDLVEDTLPQEVPVDGAPVRPLHLTCLRSVSMAPLLGVLDRLPALPAPPPPRFHPTVHVAVRPPHPVKDPADAPFRRTGFLAVANQEEWAALVEHVVRQLDLASRAAGGPPFPHPERDRFFHLSVWNNRGGDAMRSIGDIQASDIA